MKQPWSFLNNDCISKLKDGLRDVTDCSECDRVNEDCRCSLIVRVDTTCCGRYRKEYCAEGMVKKMRVRWLSFVQVQVNMAMELGTKSK